MSYQLLFRLKGLAKSSKVPRSTSLLARCGQISQVTYSYPSHHPIGKGQFTQYGTNSTREAKIRRRALLARKPWPPCPPMEYRILGRSGLKISAISLGEWPIPLGWRPLGGSLTPDDRTLGQGILGQRTLDQGTVDQMEAARRCGINFFDCSESRYGPVGAQKETVLGAVIKTLGWQRNHLVISTKISTGISPKRDFYRGTKPDDVGLSRKHIVEGVNKSLEHLKLEYVDLVYAGRPNGSTPMEETVRAFNHLIDSGKVLYWGTSDWSAGEIARAWHYADKLNMVGPLMEQPRYNMLEKTRVESEYVHLYEETGLGLTVLSPTLRSINDPTAASPLELMASVQRLKKLKPILNHLGTDMDVLALAWVLANRNVSSAICDASSEGELLKHIQALEVYKKLTPEIMVLINAILEDKPLPYSARI